MPDLREWLFLNSGSVWTCGDGPRQWGDRMLMRFIDAYEAEPKVPDLHVLMDEVYIAAMQELERRTSHA